MYIPKTHQVTSARTTANRKCNQAVMKSADCCVKFNRKTFEAMLIEKKRKNGPLAMLKPKRNLIMLLCHNFIYFFFSNEKLYFIISSKISDRDFARVFFSSSFLLIPSLFQHQFICVPRCEPRSFPGNSLQLRETQNE